MEKSKENCNHIAIFVQENSESSRTLEEYLSRKIEKVSLLISEK